MSQEIAAINWMQVGVTVASLMVSCGVMLGAAVWYLSARFERLLTLGKQVADMIPEFNKLVGRVLSLETDVAAIKRSDQDRREDFLEMRRMMGSLMRGNIQA